MLRYKIKQGIVAGLIAGIVTAFLLAHNGELADIGSLLHFKNATIGLLTHLFLSSLAGLVFGLVLGWQAKTLSRSLICSVTFCLVTWFCGPFIDSPYHSDWHHLFRTLGFHVFFGFILGFIYSITNIDHAKLET